MALVFEKNGVKRRLQGVFMIRGSSDEIRAFAERLMKATGPLLVGAPDCQVEVGIGHPAYDEDVLEWHQ